MVVLPIFCPVEAINIPLWSMSDPHSDYNTCFERIVATSVLMDRKRCRVPVAAYIFFVLRGVKGVARKKCVYL